MKKIVISMIFTILLSQPVTAGQKIIALSFDDGPGRYTNAILDILEEYNVRATFFVLGSAIEQRPETFLRTVELGHEIGNHTWNHENLTGLSAWQITQTLRNTSNLIEELTGQAPSIMRPPYGAFGSREQSIIERLGYSVIMWSVDPRDWERRNSRAIYNHITQNARHGDIILLHDIHRTTYQAVDKLIPSLIERGFTFVTVGQLLGETTPGRVYRAGTH